MMIDNNVSPVRPVARRVQVEEHEETAQAVRSIVCVEEEPYSPQFIRGLERSYHPTHRPSDVLQQRKAKTGGSEGDRGRGGG